MVNVIKKSISEQLKVLGLTDYEAKIYGELVSVTRIGATELSKKAKVSRGKIYEVLDNLEKKGFCTVITGKKKLYKAIAPQIAISKYIDDIKKEMTKKEKILHKTSENLQAIFDETKEIDTPQHYVQLLTTPSAITEAVHNFQIEGKKIIRVFMKKPIVLDESQKASDDRMDNQVKKKMKIKQIFEYGTEDFSEYALSVVQAREKGADFDVRIAKKLPLKLIIFDDNQALFSMNKETNSILDYSMMSVSHTYLTTALIELFEFHWKEAIPLEEFIKKELEKKWREK